MVIRSIRENTIYFSPMKNKKDWFEKLKDGQLTEISSSYYISQARRIFKEHGFELAHDSYVSRKRGYRLYRAVKIQEVKESAKEILSFDPAELVT